MTTATKRTPAQNALLLAEKIDLNARRAFLALIKLKLDMHDAAKIASGASDSSEVARAAVEAFDGMDAVEIAIASTKAARKHAGRFLAAAKIINSKSV